MFDSLVETFTANPYLGVALVFVICGLGFPLPEEIVLVAAGYVCFKDLAVLQLMMATCAAAIMVGDIIPFALGRVFGSRLLRLKPLRFLVNKKRLLIFDRWFRKRGDLVIFFARFVPGLRLVAYFTAGTMKVRWARFTTLDLSGIVLVVPLFTWVGWHFGGIIDEAIAQVQRVERGILITAVIAAGVLLTWHLLRRRRRTRRLLVEGPSETFVGPSIEAMPKAAAKLEEENTSR